MIERLYIKNQLSFKECDLKFENGLMAFTGPSGAGKSVFMQAILSLFGHGEANASVVEATITDNIDLETFGLENDEINIFKYVKTKSTRYFVNAGSVSKKIMSEISKGFINYLSVRDSEEFENERLITLLDALIGKKTPLHVKEVEEFKELFLEYKKVKEKLEIIEEKERKIEELKEFASFEIAKIDEVSPKIGEDEELMSFKRSLSKKEKIEESLNSANSIFDSESSVSEFLNLIEKDSTFFDESMNELRAIIEDERERLSDLEDQDVESLLERIEKISSLKSRYGSIEEILEYRDKKKQELEEYANISFEKEKLIQSCKEQLDILVQKAETISQRRDKSISILNTKINSYLDMLYMPEVNLLKSEIELNEWGKDFLHVELGRVNIKKISSGEYNRLRLAFIATTSEYLLDSGGVLILDEIDANLSGKESMSVAKVLKQLSQKYQIFAISHQPQLSSQADCHFLVTKDQNQSQVSLLNKEQRIVELARMVSGEEVSSEATVFAQKLLNVI
ncbi:AAA family ATPase [Sulfurospirillum arcachonense]|uniref:AAA family ATPase n=1 Tax=Sulfurospirillum arcachonense TaxID=57666 RepID=UPI0004698B89|nr:AAA family ATPase [Sulfurospirillum arcachonense]